MLKNLLYIGLGGGIGSIGRFLCQKWVYQAFPGAFPWGTFTVNLAGSFVIGILYALAEKGNLLSPEARLLLITGFCGGFTTFSSFAYENVGLLRTGDFSYALLYSAGSILLGILFTYLGIALMRLI
jgi:CrcB protein